jgi:hypothetical protein
MTTTKGGETRRAHTTGTKAPAATANDQEKRAVRALKSAERWLRRRGDSRENNATKRAYTLAAKRIHELTTTRG